MKNKNLFIITSAICTTYGFSDSADERLLQTIHTIDSIRSKYDNVDIWIIDASVNGIKPYMINLLNAEIIDMSSDEEVLNIFKTSQGSDETMGFIKNRTESYFTLKVLKERADQIKAYERVYKISGRYFLSNKFNASDHLVKNKIVIKEKTRSLFKNPIPITGSEFKHDCVIYSFCSSLIEDMINILDMIRKDIELSFLEYTKGNLRYCDMEHALYLHLPKEKVKYIQHVHVIGRIGGTENKLYVG